MTNFAHDSLRIQFARFVNEARSAHGLTSDELAARTKTARAYISRIEHGLVNMTCSTIDALTGHLIHTAGTLEKTATTVALRVRSRREEAGITMEQLATATTVTVQSIGRIERKVANAEIDTIEKLALGLGCSGLDLISPMTIDDTTRPKLHTTGSRPKSEPLSHEHTLPPVKAAVKRHGRKTKSKAPKQYEYKTVELFAGGSARENAVQENISGFSSALNKEGQDGWMLVQIISAAILSGTVAKSSDSVYALFQRELPL